MSAELLDGSTVDAELDPVTGAVQALNVDLSQVSEFLINTGARIDSPSLVLLSELTASP